MRSNYLTYPGPKSPSHTFFELIEARDVSVGLNYVLNKGRQAGRQGRSGQGRAGHDRAGRRAGQAGTSIAVRDHCPRNTSKAI